MGERILRPGIRTSDRTAALVRDGGWMAQVFYDWLITVVDDYGRYDARPSILRVEVFPLLLDLVRESDVQRCLAACEKAVLIRLYVIEDKPFLELLNFNQRLRSAKSRWPAPDNGASMSSQRHVNVMTMPTDTDTDTEKNTSRGKPRGTRKPRKIPQHVPVAQFFAERWKERHGRDHPPLKNLHYAKAYELVQAAGSADAAQTVIRRYLADPDPFIRGHSLPKLLMDSVLNRYLVRDDAAAAKDCSPGFDRIKIKPPDDLLQFAVEGGSSA